jgi:hypothetical protein
MPLREKDSTTCCTPAGSLRWLQVISEGALAGDDDYARLLGHVAEHWLQASGRQVVTS